MSSHIKDPQPQMIMTRHRSQELQTQSTVSSTRSVSKKQKAVERGRRLNEILREKKERGEIKRSGRPAQSKSKKAGIHFPVARLIRKFKAINSKMTIQTKSGVMLAAVVEYLTAEVLELSGYVTREQNRKTISPRDIFLAVKNDDELDKLLHDTVITQSGAVPHINPVLLVKSKRSKTKSQPDATEDSLDQEQVEIDQELVQIKGQCGSTPKKRVLVFNQSLIFEKKLSAGKKNKNFYFSFLAIFLIYCISFSVVESRRIGPCEDICASA
ncbi:histone H2A [Brachionus plicatilis]|uniref:Histone H2A n=1 Tax=Brachionus plicatilis TaxID=10195 RepID=A0A3M7T238_BRAPC|nr:histone H2A [Brachionus plicatilis]